MQVSNRGALLIREGRCQARRACDAYMALDLPWRQLIELTLWCQRLSTSKVTRLSEKLQKWDRTVKEVIEQWLQEPEVTLFVAVSIAPDIPSPS